MYASEVASTSMYDSYTQKKFCQFARQKFVENHVQIKSV